MIDTTNDPIVQCARPQPWGSWMRGEDYYSEGMLIWLEVDSKLRQMSGGQPLDQRFRPRLLRDQSRRPGLATYTFDDVVRTLNAIQPYDWATYLHDRVYHTGPAPLAWIQAGGYRLVYRDTPTPYYMSREQRPENLRPHLFDRRAIGEGGRIAGVAWDSPMFNAGATAGATIVAVNGHQYSNDRLRQAIREAQGNRDPIRLLIKRGERYQEAALDYHDGLRYPALERVGSGPSSLDALLAPL